MAYCESCKRELDDKYFNKSKGQCVKKCKHCLSVAKTIKNYESIITKNFDRIYPEIYLTSSEAVASRFEDSCVPSRRPGYTICGSQHKDYRKELMVYKLWITELYKERLQEVDALLNNCKVREWQNV